MKATKNHPALNAHAVTWAEFFPAYGIVTKHDMRQIVGMTATTVDRPKTYRKFFANKQKALEWLAAFNKPLDKPYTVRLFTDKQLSLAKQSENYRIPYTHKQWAETYEIGDDKE